VSGLFIYGTGEASSKKDCRVAEATRNDRYKIVDRCGLIHGSRNYSLFFVADICVNGRDKLHGSKDGHPIKLYLVLLCLLTGEHCLNSMPSMFSVAIN